MWTFGEDCTGSVRILGNEKCGDIKLAFVCQ